MNRPHTVVIVAMSADGKIADEKRSPARFGTKADKIHLEKQISQVDGVLFGATTLRAYQTSLPITNPELLQWRKIEDKPLQPIHIVVSASGNLDPKMPFFQQPIPRWLLTTSKGLTTWKKLNFDGFEQILIINNNIITTLDWVNIFQKFRELGLQKIAVLGGGELVAAILSANLIDEFYLTLCPIILGGTNAPTPIEGIGLKPQQLELLNVKQVEQELFLHYRLTNN
jgi:5-amino-6-(5-phosphoribosylamino)uracil reductase